MTVPVVPTRVVPQDYSFVLNGSAQNPLAAAYPAAAPAGQYPTQTGGVAGANPNRSHLQFQSPATITYSYTNPSPNDPAVANATGCYTLPAGQNWGLGPWIPTTPIYINGGSAGSGTRVTLTEC